MYNNFLKIVIVTISFFLLLGCNNDNSDEKSAATNSDDSVSDGEITFYIVRHGKTMLNTTDRVQGWSDAVLTPNGEDVVQSAGRGMKNIEFKGAYSSDSGRAIQTADIILNENGKSTDLHLKTDDRLREFNFGTYEGDLNETMWTDIANSQGKTLEEWFDEGISPEVFANSVAELDKENVKEEGVNWAAEDYNTITTRLTDAINEIAELESKKGDGNVLIVSHGLSISALLDTLFEDFELPPDGLDNASVTVINYKDGEFSLGKINDLSYVEEGEE